MECAGNDAYLPIVRPATFASRIAGDPETCAVSVSALMNWRNVGRMDAWYRNVERWRAGYFSPSTVTRTTSPTTPIPTPFQLSRGVIPSLRNKETKPTIAASRQFVRSFLGNCVMSFVLYPRGSFMVFIVLG